MPLQYRSRHKLNLVGKDPTSLKKTHEKNSFTSLRTATKQLLTLDSFILLNLRLSGLQTRAWCGVAPLFAVNLLLGTPFIDSCIRGIFPSERKILPWQSHPVAILKRRKSFAATTTNRLSPAFSKGTVRKVIQDEFTTTFIRVARHILVQGNSATQVLVTTTASRILLIQLQLQCFFVIKSSQHGELWMLLRA